VIELPEEFAYLAEAADRCQDVVDAGEQDAFIDAMGMAECSGFVDLYRQIVERGDKSRLDAFFDSGGANIDAWSGYDALLRLLFVLDRMANRGLIPAELGATRFIEWIEFDESEKPAEDAENR
jgi:hypothetical protein